MANFCENCGTPISDESVFCDNCGYRVHETVLLENMPRQITVQPGLKITFIEDDKIIKTYDLLNQNSSKLTFGRDASNDIAINSSNKVLSRHHGYFEYKNDGWYIVDNNSANGFTVNNIKQDSYKISEGDIIVVGALAQEGSHVIILVGTSEHTWNIKSLASENMITIGRNEQNTLCLSAPTVSAFHAQMIKMTDGNWYIKDLDSFNGTFVNGARLQGQAYLPPGSQIAFSLANIIFTGSALIYSNQRSGVDIVAANLTQIRKTKGGERVTNDNISLHIHKGEFVSIVGGSGAGKSTLLNELNGTDFAAKGNVYIDGIDLYSNYETLKSLIGYVPQQDTVYDNLKLFDMLMYASELRMPSDSTVEERKNRANEVIAMLDLDNEKYSMIKNLSGGQKKRASIAVELLSDPKLLFLDEPTSGLDPGIERELMNTLAEMARDGRTIVLVTHTTSNIHLCNRVVFLAPGGKLAYSGPPSELLEFFPVGDIANIYVSLAKYPNEWQQYYLSSPFCQTIYYPTVPYAPPKTETPSFFRQLATLSKRYCKLLLNDRVRTILLLLQAPLLSGLICIVAGNDCFKICENTNSCLFALCCAAFWVGILDSIQEVCKERNILQREYSGGLRISSYVASKVLILSLLCLIQSVLLTSVFVVFCGTPNTEPLFFNSVLEMYITMFLLVDSAMCLGLWISCLFKNSDRAIAMAPILIMPQVLFSGLIFELKGAAEVISYFVNCKWGMEAFDSSADINSLDLSIYDKEITIPESTQSTAAGNITVPEQTKKIDGDMYPHDVDPSYLHTLPHLMTDWAILAGFCVICIILCAVTLTITLKKRR